MILAATAGSAFAAAFSDGNLISPQKKYRGPRSLPLLKPFLSAAC
jgi:hypothetical protein